MKRQLLSAAVIAGLMLVAAWSLSRLQAYGLLPGGRAELSQRMLNVLVGLMVVWIANAAPKRLKPLSETACAPAREQAHRRFSGLVVVIGGLLYALAWLAAPVELALPLSVMALAAAALVVLAQCLLFVPRGQRPTGH